MSLLGQDGWSYVILFFVFFGTYNYIGTVLLIGLCLGDIDGFGPVAGFLAALFIGSLANMVSL